MTTQNRSKLGETVPELQKHLKSPEAGVNVRADVDKSLFSMVTPEVQALLPDPTKDPLDAIIVGIESHVCVTQTALDLLTMGHRIYVLVDGVSSMNAEERGVALARLRDAGAIVTTSESILFEILQDSNRAEFKAVSGLVKETKETTKGSLQALAKF